MKKAKTTIDILMVLALLLLMAYSLVGECAHEVIGIGMFALFLAHHVVNRKWWTNLFKGKYRPARMLNTAVNILLAVAMVLQPVSGVLLSKHVLKEVMVDGAAGTLRTIHMLVPYWSFLLMGFHLGLHIRMVSGNLRKRFGAKSKTAIVVCSILVAGYGVYAFIKRGIGDYLLMKVGFAFFDTQESTALFLLDYAAVMALTAEVGYMIQNRLMNIKRKAGK